MWVSPQDDDFLARVKHQYERRKKLGALYVGTAVVFAMTCVWFYFHADEQMNRVLAAFGVAQNEDDPIQQGLDLVAFQLGLLAGGTLTGLGIGAASLLGLGIDLIWGQRKERLLLELANKVAGQRSGRAT